MITGELIDGKIQLTGQQGTTWEFELELFTDDANLVPFDLTGYLARGQYRKDKTPDALLLISFTCTVLPHNDATNPLNNKVKVRAEAEQSSALNDEALRFNNTPILRGVFDIEVYKLDGANEIDVKRPIEGTLIVTPEVTK